MWLQLLLCVVPFFSVIQGTQSANILVFNAVGTHSTRISMMPYMEALADKGHNVTFLSAFENNDPNKHPKIIEYLPKKWKEAMGPWEEHIRFFDVRKNKKMINMWYGMKEAGLGSCTVLYSDPEFVEWVKSSKFDLVVVESSFNECGYGLVHWFNAKSITYSTTTVFQSYYDAHGLPDESSSVSDLIFNFPPGNQMSFWERVVNAINPITYTLMRHYSYFPQLEEITKTALGLEEIPKFSEIEKNTSLILLTTHFSLEYPRSFSPNTFAIGGNVVSKTKKPLQKDMQNFINEGKDGFIYISFGTVCEFVNFDEDVQQEFIAALYNFPDLRFVWKSSFQINITLPSNVLVTKWAPQQTLLAHPKIKAFVTHAGMGSIAEAIHFSVPVVGVPIMADQDLNAQVVVSRDAGIKLEIIGLKSQDLEDAITEILHDKKYRIGMTKLTEVFKDRQVSPLDTAVWWTEYILRHENSNLFLRPPSVGQSWWVKRQIDVWISLFLVFQVVFCILAYAMFLAIRKVLRHILNNPDECNKQKKE
ncbi:UDP-glucuronosyltransferase 1-8, partial [Orchesella cincta]